MYVLDGTIWKDDFLDEHCGPGQCRIDVRIWQVLAPIDDLYVIRQNNFAFLWNYVLHVGPVDVWRKVTSRLSERLRNSKYAAVGAGIVSQSNECSFETGEAVVFAAPCHPQCVNSIVLDDRLMRAAPENLPKISFSSDRIFFHAWQADSCLPAWAGWSPLSGQSLDFLSVDQAIAAVFPISHSERRPPSKTLIVRSRELRECFYPKAKADISTTLGATVFGLGNHAKTVIIPNLDRRIRLDCIHEIDPTQLGSIAKFRSAVDTAPHLRSEEKPDVVFVAGYHHTHANLAIEALNRVAAVVVEKPLATTFDQLDRLTRAIETNPGRLFAAFHKRYSQFNSLIASDLDVSPGDPISCHCLVYEIPLPGRHWYNWRNSGSRILSNGCHWIDYFLFLNDFADVVRQSVICLSGGDVVITMELSNAAAFTMTLTEKGSERLGVQDHVQLRANGRTVRIDNSSLYVAESKTRIIRRRREPKNRAIHNMYRRISANIADGMNGDSLRSILVSGRAVLNLEAELLCHVENHPRAPAG